MSLSLGKSITLDYHDCMDKPHLKRIQDELKAAGAGVIARRTPESHELAKLIHHNEHIGGVVYGTYTGGLAWLVATDQRMIFLDRKPFFSTHDELTYDIVFGTTSTRAGLFVTMILHTRIHDYSISFVNPTSARIFMKYVDNRRLRAGSFNQATQRYSREAKEQPKRPKTLHLPVPIPYKPPPTGDKELRFLKEHGVGVLSTVDRTGNLDGAVVYYYVDERGLIYILTKSETVKGRNVFAHSQVALTVYEVESRQTLQLQGVVEVETEQATKDKILAQMTNPHLYGEKIELPPVTKLRKGAFMVVRITPTSIKFHDYSERET
jgi:general stress protein 26